MRETVVNDSCTVQRGGPQARERPNSPISLGIAAPTAEDRILEDYGDGARGTDPRARVRRNTCLPRRGVRARIRRVAGCATPTGSAGHAGATANLKLTFYLDHSAGLITT
jgi:hypothetical protein